MKTILASIAALGALAMAAPASAQDYRYGDAYRVSVSRFDGDNYQRRSFHQLNRIADHIRDGQRYGAINQREARRLYGELREVTNLRMFYIRTRGLQRWEARDLQERIADLRQDVRRAMFYDHRRFGEFRTRFDHDDAFRGEPRWADDDRFANPRQGRDRD